MVEKVNPVVHIVSGLWMGIRSRLSLRVLFPVTVLCLITTIVYIMMYTPIPTTPDLCKLWGGESPRPNATLWWQWACLIEEEMDKPPAYTCNNMQYMGNWPVCFDDQYKPQKNCLVYSFGIDNDFSFDDAMAAQGCTVYSFDPSMGVEDHQHAERVYFKNLGLGSEDTDTFHPNFDSYVRQSSNWKMRTLKSIITLLGHEKRTIDILKIDIEVYEWDVVARIMEDGLFAHVRQFLVEWHIFPNEPSREHFPEFYHTFTNLHELGLRFYFKNSGSSRIHHYRYFNSQADMCYVNTKVKDTR